jgi:hypothetical protein
MRGWLVALLLCLGALAAPALWWLQQPDPPPVTRGLGDDLSVALGAGSQAPLPPRVTGTIEGTVLRPGGEPATEAEVSALLVGTSHVRTAQTDAAGRFRMTDMEDGAWMLEARLQGLGPALAHAVRPDAAPLRLVLTSGREVQGMVLRQRASVPGAVVYLGGPGLYPPRTVVTDEAGRYRFYGVRPGTWTLLVAGRGLGTGWSESVTVPADGSTEPIQHDIQVRPASVSDLQFRDRATGERIHEVRITLSDRAMHSLAVHWEAADGQTLIDWLPVGEYYLRAQAPGYLPIAQRFWIGNSRDQWLVMSQGSTIRGRVRDLAGNGVPNVQLVATVTLPDGSTREMTQSPLDQTVLHQAPDGTSLWAPTQGFFTDAQGSFELKGLPAGDVVLRTDHRGWATATTPVLRLGRDQRVEGVELVLGLGRSIRGRITDPGGGGVADVAIRIQAAGQPPWSQGVHARSDSRGMFRVDGISEAVEVVVDHPSWDRMEFPLAVPPQGLDNLRIVLHRTESSSYRGRLFLPRGQPAFGARVWLMSERNEVPICRAEVGENGWFEAEGCTAVPERIAAVHPDAAPLLAGVGGSTQPRDWHLPRGGQLDVVTQRQLGEVEIEPAFALPAELWPRPVIPSETRQRVRVEQLAPGAYRVLCRAAGMSQQVLDVTVREGARSEVACPWLQPLVTMPIYVVDAQGARVPGSVVFVDGVEPAIRTLTDGSGSITIEAPPDTWLRVEAMHEGWGRGQARIRVPSQPPEPPARVRLLEPVGGDDTDAFLTQLREWGVEAVQDFRSVVVDQVQRDSPTSSLGLRRGDRVLWLRPVTDRRWSLGVRRQREVLSFDLVR